MTAIAAPAHGRIGLDKLGVLTTAIALYGLFGQPFMLFRANRIVLGEPHTVLGALPPLEAAIVYGVLAGAVVLAVFRTPPLPRLLSAVLAVGVLAVFVGRAASHLTPPEDNFSRVSPGAGFWLMLFAFALTLTDALARMRLAPLMRVGLLVLAFVLLGALLWSGAWDDLSILREYANRADLFWRELRAHLWLAFGSLGAAILAGVPLGILSYRVAPLRNAILNVLNIVQTIPSIAMFGILIAPMAWIGANIPGAGAIGIAGIGMAPALVALFAYSLLPVVSNTVVGLDTVPREANDAARGMGMTDRQRLIGVELPLAFSVILTGIRIVLVQNIGLAVIAGLIGGGGLGTLVFQGIAQTAMDLVLLGAIPAVIMAFSAAIVLDAAIEASQPERQEERA